MTIVNSWNEWDQLKHVIVGVAENSNIPPMEPALEPNITEILNQLELDPIKTIELAKSENINQKYLNQTEIAKSKKIFGSPTFIYNNEVFWGDDRLEDCIKWSNLN